MKHSEVVDLLKADISQDKGVLLDDGEFYIEHNATCELTQGNGFLHRRCQLSRCTPGGYDVVGGYELRWEGKWRADISIQPPDRADGEWEPEDECRVLGHFVDRLDAIAALWLARHDAYSRYAMT